MPETDCFAHQIFSSRLGSFGVVVDPLNRREPVRAVFLPVKNGRLQDAVGREFPGSICRRCVPAGRIGKKIQRHLDGDMVLFTLAGLDFSGCSAFQKKVLELNFLVPRGKVTTYGRMAAKLGSPGGARAVGTALAANPFPIIIPCHRVVRADGNPGGFGGGLEMKKALLEMEGVIFAKNGHVLPEFMI